MSAGANFFLCSCVILTFTIINLNVGPIVNGIVGSSWPSENCKIKSDEIDEMEKNPNITKEEIEKKEIKLRECRNKRAMHDMEYTSFIFNAAIGFVCTLLGIFGLQKEIIKKTGMVGAGLGVIGFVLTLVYVIYNGVVYTNYYSSSIYKRDSDGAVAELISPSEFKYRCIYFNKANDTETLYAKFSDLIKSQYNYNRELIDSFNNSYPEKYGCIVKYNNYKYYCSKDEIWEIPMTYYDKEYNEHKCEKLYYENYKSDKPFQNDSNYDISARFLTVLIFSILIILCHCGLVCSGLMLMKEA